MNDWIACNYCNYFKSINHNINIVISIILNLSGAEQLLLIFKLNYQIIMLRYSYLRAADFIYIDYNFKIIFLLLSSQVIFGSYSKSNSSCLALIFGISFYYYI